jgi:hypothetical protein
MRALAFFALVAGCGGAAPNKSGGGPGTGFRFAVFGDCRPKDPASPYPSDVLGNILRMATARGAEFVVGTGDYMAAYNPADVAAQVPLFNKAAAQFNGPMYLAMGNHECTGATASNCPRLDETANVRAFLTLLPPGIDKPYYRIDKDTPRGRAKFVFIAANAWDATQAAWLRAELADPTPYTFVVRHESTTSYNLPLGAIASEADVMAAKFTLELLGHSHEYRHVDARHVISGNGGAPLTGGSYYGFLLVEQLSDGNISVQAIDQASGNAIDVFTVSP